MFRNRGDDRYIRGTNPLRAALKKQSAIRHIVVVESIARVQILALADIEANFGDNGTRKPFHMACLW